MSLEKLIQHFGRNTRIRSLEFVERILQIRNYAGICCIKEERRRTCGTNI